VFWTADGLGFAYTPCVPNIFLIGKYTQSATYQMSYERHRRLQVLNPSVPILTKIGFRGKPVASLFSV